MSTYILLLPLWIFMASFGRNLLNITLKTKDTFRTVTTFLLLILPKKSRIFLSMYFTTCDISGLQSKVNLFDLNFKHKNTPTEVLIFYVAGRANRLKCSRNGVLTVLMSMI
jgi:hypothetical protein